jgi:hypothetical protein
VDSLCSKKLEVPRRNSQGSFSEQDQTVIIFDWDDTLFPTTYVRSDLGLSLKIPLKDQRIDEKLKAEVAKKLAACAQKVEQLLRFAVNFGKVIIVTLARHPWVVNSCEYFYEGIGSLLEELDVKVVYAQRAEQVDYNKLKMMSDIDEEMYWSRMKGRAIAQEVRNFYMQYPGQSWKNVISIGDSDFERIGTKFATEEYMRKRKIFDAALPQGSPSPPGVQSNLARVTVEANVQGHLYRVRTKTFKLVDQPTVEELLVELNMCKKWLPLMVKLDDGFDVDINNLEDPSQIQAIEGILRGNQDLLVDSQEIAWRCSAAEDSEEIQQGSQYGKPRSGS